MNRKAIFPGSFDPITLGHFDIIQRGVSLFDEVIVAIGINADKKYMFSLEDRKRFIEEAFKDEPKVKVITYTGLTIDLCKKKKPILSSEVYEIQLILSLKKPLHTPIENYPKLRLYFY